MKTFEQFISEKYKPVQDETCGIEDNQAFRTGDVINYVEKHCKIEDVKVSELKKFSSLTKDNIENLLLISVHADGIDDLIKKYGKKSTIKDLSEDEKEKVIELETKVFMKTNLKYPIVVITDKKGKYTGILDGNHRVAKADKLGYDTIKSYVIPYDELVKNLENINENLRTIYK